MRSGKLGSWTRLDSGYNHSYTMGVKTAISIPNEVYEAAEKLAKRLGMSRSELYSTAVARFVEQHHSANVTARVNQVCDQIDTSADPALRRMQSESLPEDTWE